MIYKLIKKFPDKDVEIGMYVKRSISTMYYPLNYEYCTADSFVPNYSNNRAFNMKEVENNSEYFEYISGKETSINYKTNKTNKMKIIIKKTISCELGKEDYIIALMAKISFNEIERYVTGGKMSSEKMIITFEGFDSDYNENNYLKQNSDREGFYYYYSLREPNGYYTDKLEIFKSIHEKSIYHIDILSFEN